MRTPFRDADHAALSRAAMLEEQSARLQRELAAARASLASERETARSSSPHRAFVRAMLLSATFAVVVMLVVLGMLSAR